MRRYFFSLALAAVASLAPALTFASEADDKAAAEQIATILRDSGQMKNYSVGVKYKNGTVWLTGRVSNNQQKQKALQVISDIEGIEQIVDSLSVEKPGGASVKQPAAGTRRVSATSADVNMASADAADEAIPAGYHGLAMKHAAKHPGKPLPVYAPSMGAGNAPAYDQPHMPNYAWPSYAAYPNYAALTYPKQYSASAFPFIGPFYPYPQVPLGWRKVSLEWDDGWWFLDFQDRGHY